MNQMLFSSRMKLADLLLTNHKLLLVLNRFDIQLGFGDKSVQEVCDNQLLPAHLFLLVCNVYTFEAYLPNEEELKTIDTLQLVKYLQKSHIYYKGKCLPDIHNQLKKITEEVKSTSIELLQRFYDGYQAEVLNHFDYEESVAFPYATYLAKGEKSQAYKISQFEKNHSNIDEKLNDLKSIIIKYLPGIGMQDELNELLFLLFELEEDFRKHTLIENKILIPLVTQLEAKE